MRRILPAPAQDREAAAIVAAEDRTPPPDRPWVMVNMVMTADGSVVAGNGRSGPLGGPADRAMFRALRGQADVILAGATTARLEDYGPPRLPPTVEAARTAAGRAPRPRLAVVCGSLNLDPRARLFQGGPDDPRPIVVTATASIRAHAAAAGLEEVATLVPAGEETVDLARACRILAREYATRVLLVEGGPSLNHQLIAADLVDELCLTVSPTLSGGAPLTVASGTPTDLRRLDLSRVAEEDGFLLLRYLRSR